MLSGVNRRDLIQRQRLDPRPIIECLRNNPSRSSIPLQLEYVDMPVVIDRQDVDDPAKIRSNLATDDEQVHPNERWVSDNHVLEAPLGSKRREIHAFWSGLGHPP